MEEKPKFWVLDGHTPVPATLREFGDMMKDPESRHVSITKTVGVQISTVFLGLDHNFLGTGLPLLFETMIFGGEHDEHQERCSTWGEAEECHARAVDLVQNE